ncbi:MAG TPA: PP2C family protein-serine/threonine phosphatase [Terriglobales bacterium]|nr:PP2C family protein-serine/threonine phosphatase [Terriglobales bacterium]
MPAAATSPHQVPPTPPPPMPPRHPNFVQKVEDFWHRVTEGLELQQLWNQFQTEARTGYRLYSRDVEARGQHPQPGRNNWVHTAGEFFWAVLMKLSPAKRVILLVALVLLMLGALDFTVNNTRVSFDARTFGGLLILLILVLETADRVIMKRDLEIAKEIQHWLVPSEAPEVPGLDVGFVTRAANTVAGDYYDIVPRVEPGKYLIAIADVAGKSMPAALLMATFQASLKTLSAASPSLVDLVYGLNRYACDHSIRGTRFTTAFLAEYDSSNCTLNYVNAGHNPPVLLRGTDVQHLTEGGVPLGILHDASYQSGQVQLHKGDMLAIFTDGVVEAENVAGQEFGEDRLVQVLRLSNNGTAKQVIGQIMANIEAFVATAPQHDDITCMVVRCVQ